MTEHGAEPEGYRSQPPAPSTTEARELRGSLVPEGCGLATLLLGLAAGLVFFAFAWAIVVIGIGMVGAD